MPESFTLNFNYQGIPREINCSLRTGAYAYQFLCIIGGTEIIMEKDDEGNLRARQADPFSGHDSNLDIGLVRATVEELDRSFFNTNTV